MQIRKDSFIEKELQEFFTDILYEVNINNSPAFIYLLFEHQSSPDKLVAFRLLRYFVKIWELYLKQNNTSSLPPIIPLILYHGKKRWTINQKFSNVILGHTEELAQYTPNFSYLLYDLSRYTDEEIKGNISLRIFLSLFKHIFDDDLFSHLENIFKLLKKLSYTDKSGLEYIELVLRYIMNTSDKPTTNELKEIVEKIISKDTGGTIMSLASQLIEEGRLEGRQEGRLEGRQEGRLEGILEAIKLGLELKFGLKGLSLYPKVEKEKDFRKLEIIKEAIRITTNINELEEMVK